MPDPGTPGPTGAPEEELPPAPLSDRVLAAAASPFGDLDGGPQLTLAGFDGPSVTGPGAPSRGPAVGGGEGGMRPAHAALGESEPIAPVLPPTVSGPVLDPAAMLRQRGEGAVSPAKRAWLRRIGGLAAAIAVTFGATQYMAGDRGGAAGADAPRSGYVPNAPTAMAQGFLPFLQVASASAQFADPKTGGVAEQPAVFKQGAREGSAVLHAQLLSHLTDPEARMAVFVSAANLATQTGDQSRMATLTRLAEQWPAAEKQDWRLHMSLEELYHRLADAAIASRQDTAMAVRFTQRAEAAGRLAKETKETVKGQGWTEQTLREINDAVRGARDGVPQAQPALFVSGYQRAIDESVQRVLVLSGLELEAGRTAPLMTAQETVKAVELGRARLR